MKLNILTSILLVLVTSVSFSQNQIPNNSLENWITDTISYPAGYYASGEDTNSIYSNTCIPSTDSYSGNYSIKLETIIQGQDTAIGHFINSRSTTTASVPFNFAADSIHGYYKSNLVGLDNAFIRVQLFQNGFDIGSSTISFSTSNNTSTWTKFSIPTNRLSTATPNTILFEAYSSNSENPNAIENGSWVMFDSIYFTDIIGSTDTLNNFDFERWVERPIEQLKDFSSTALKSHDLIHPLIEKTSDASDGYFAVNVNTIQDELGFVLRGLLSTGEIRQEGIIWQGGKPFIGKPNFLTFDYKFKYVTNDYAIVTTQFTKNGELFMAGVFGAFLHTPTTEYKQDTINFIFQEAPDTLVLLVVGGDYPKTTLTVDNFVFHYLVGVTEIGSLFQVESYPNPTSNILNFEIKSKLNQSATISVIDMTGRVLKQQNLSFSEGLNRFSLSLDFLSSGNYVYIIDFANQKFSKPFVKN